MSESSKDGLKSCTRCGASLRWARSPALCPACVLEFGFADSTASPESNTKLQLSQPQTPEDYLIFEEIGRGGMGVVYRALHLRLQRPVALKFIRFTGTLPEKEVLRFRTEALLAAKLQHPNIVAIFDVGIQGGQPFYAMQLIEGQTLSQRLGQGSVDPDRGAEWVKQIAEAIHYAHSQGILHRDLKPSNVILDAEQVPHILDFGLAKSESASVLEPQLTLAGSILGSPSYMSPEQVRADSASISPRTDVYALGAILYECLTGRPPFTATHPMDVLKAVLEQLPPSPRTLEPRVPRDLETICLKCLSKEPAERYPTADDLASDLGRYLRHEPIRARPLNLFESFWNWCRRQPAIAAAILTTVTALVAGLTTTTLQWRRAEHAQAQAIRANQELTTLNTQLRLRQAADGIEQSHPQDSLLQLARLLREQPTNALAAALIHGFVGGRQFIPLPLEAPFVGGEVYALAFSHSGHWLAAWSQVSGEITLLPIVNGEVHPQDRRLLPIALHGDRMAGFVFSRDDRFFLAVARDGSVAWWDLEKNALVRDVWHLSNSIRAATFDSHAQAVVGFAGYEELTRCEGTPGATPSRLLLGHSVGIVRFSPDGEYIAGVCKDGRVRIWETRLAQRVAQSGSLSTVRDLSWDPGSSRVMIATEGSDLVSLAYGEDLEFSKRPRPRWQGSEGVDAVTFSPDGTKLATIHGDKSLQVWDSTSGERWGVTLRPNYKTREVAFAHHNRWLVVEDFDQRLHVWDLQNGQPLFAPLDFGLGEHVWQVHEAKELVAFAGFSGKVRILELEDRAPHHLSLNLSGNGVAADLSPDGNRVLTADSQGELSLWDAVTGTRLREWKDLSSPVTCVRFSPKGSRFAIGFENGSALCLETESFQQISQGIQHAGSLSQVRFSPDGNVLMTGSTDRTIRLWSPEGQPLSPPLDMSDRVWCTDFSPNGKILVTASRANHWNLWSVPTGELLETVNGSAAVSSIRYSPDGSWIAIGHFNGAIQLWDTSKHSTRSELGARSGRVNVVEFSPDSHQLLDASQANKATLWNFQQASGKTLELPLDGAANAAAFCFDGHAVVAGSDSGKILCLDSTMGMILFQFASHRGEITDLRLDTQGRRMLTRSKDGIVKVHALPPPPFPPPAWLAELAEALAQSRLDGSGHPTSIPSNGRTYQDFVLHPPAGDYGKWVQAQIAPLSYRNQRRVKEGVSTEPSTP